MGDHWHLACYATRVRTLPTNPKGSLEIAVAVVVVFTAMTVNFALMLICVCIPLSGISMGLTLAAALAGIAGLPLLPPALWGYRRWRVRRFLRAGMLRTNRLAAIVANDRARERLPHRMLEHYLRRDEPLRRVIRLLPRGHVFVVNAQLAEGERLPIPTSVPFEPIDIDEQAEATYWYVLAAQEEAGGLTVEEMLEEPDGRPPEKRFDLRVLWFVPTGLAVLLVLLSATSICAVPSLLVVIGLAVSGYIAALFVRTDRFLVPGGIVFRQDAFWRRGQRVSLVTATNSPFVWRDDTGEVAVLDGEQPRVVGSGAASPTAILCGWLSTARTPTLEEVKSFLGADEPPRNPTEV